MKKGLLFLLCLFSFMTITNVMAQDRRISGTVIGSDDGQGVPGVTVRVQGSVNATQTDAQGRYAINASQGDVLSFTAIGYETTNVTVGAANVVNVSLNLSISELDEIVVIPYGSIRKADFVGSATTIGARDIESRPLSNPIQSLQGAGPGIQTTTPSGSPGSSPGVTIRGIGSYSASNSALYVVDGVEFSGGMANINPDDVETITVLKDAATIALYGSRGANGVVMVTTKKGQKNKSSVNFKMQFGVNENGIPSYNTVNAGEYYELMWEAYKNNMIYGPTPIPADAAAQIASGKLPRNSAGNQVYDGRTYQDVVQLLGNYNAFNVANDQLVGVDGRLNPSAQLKYADDLNWLDQSSRKGKRNEYSLTYSTGTDKTTLYTSLNYLDEQGWGLRSTLERFAARVNVNTDLKPWLKAGLNLNANRNNYNNPATGSSSINNPFSWSRGIAPIYPVHVHDPVTGQYILDENGDKIFDLGNMVAQYGISRPYNSGRHALAETLWNIDVTGRDFIGARTFLEFKLLPWLSFNTTLSSDLTNQRGESYENTKVGDGAPAGRYYQGWDRTFSYTFYQTLNAEKSFGDHFVNLVLGHENFDYNYEDIGGRRTGEGFSDFYVFSNFTDILTLSSSLSQRAMESYFASLNYDFGERFHVMASIRSDGDSRMPPANRWSQFWSVGAFWRLDKEAWFNVPAFDMLKLKASYGRLGNSNVGTYPYQPGYGILNNSSYPGAVLSALGSPDLKWEGQNPLDIALDWSIYRGRLTGTLEYYNRRSNGLLFSIPQPYHNGGTTGGSFSISKNVGNMENKGVELSLTGLVMKNRDFDWKMTFNISRQYNKILQMPEETPELISEPYNRTAGYSIYEYYTRTFYGVDPDNGAVLYKGVTSYTDGNPNIKIIGGDTLTYDQNLAARSFIGKSALPKGYGSLINNLSYKNFDFNFVLTYQFGGWVMNSAFMSAGPSNGANLHKDLLNGWRKPGDITDIPRMDMGQTAQFGAGSTRWLVKSDYLNLSAVNLGYRIPKAATNYLHLNGARVFVGAENLIYFTKKKGMSTMSSLTGATSSSSYNHARTLNFGINVNL